MLGLRRASICSRCGVERPTNSTRGLPVTAPRRGSRRSLTGNGTERHTGSNASAAVRDERVERDDAIERAASTCASSHRRRSRS